MNNNLELNERILDLLTSTGLNWEVSKEPLISSVDNASTGSFGIFQKSSRKHLGTVGNQYVPFQNFQLAETVINAGDQIGVTMSRGGELSGGRKVYIQAELPEVHIAKSNMKRWITGLNSHDGSSSLGFGSSNTVVVCQNTFYMAFKEVAKFRHTATAEDRIRVAALNMNAALRADEKQVQIMQKMAAEPFNEGLAAKVMAKLFEVKEGTKASDISSRKRNQLQAFGQALETEVILEGNNMWAFFNAVTRYTNHIVKHNAGSEKLDYLMSGGGYEMSTLTFNMLAKELDIEFSKEGKLLV